MFLLSALKIYSTGPGKVSFAVPTLRIPASAPACVWLNKPGSENNRIPSGLNKKIIKLLGIYIDENLSFSIHTEETFKKGGRQRSALRRLSFYLDSKVKLAVFTAFILSHFKYCFDVRYHDSASIPNACCVEKIQKRALKCVYSNHTASYESLLNKAPECSHIYYACYK